MIFFEIIIFFVVFKYFMICKLVQFLYGNIVVVVYIVIGGVYIGESDWNDCQYSVYWMLCF